VGALPKPRQTRQDSRGDHREDTHGLVCLFDTFNCAGRRKHRVVVSSIKYNQENPERGSDGRNVRLLALSPRLNLSIYI
jgi:hypothetical protein